MKKNIFDYLFCSKNNYFYKKRFNDLVADITVLTFEVF